jgi:hypothetical protein
MQKWMKKSIALVICLMFLLTAVASCNAIKIEKNNDVEDEPDKYQSSSRSITLQRVGPDGSITPIEVTLKLENDEDLIEAVIEKCEELMNSDAEMKNLFDVNEDEDDENGLEIDYRVKITSYGRGFHFKTKYRFTFVFLNRFFNLLFPWIRLQFTRPWVFCRYDNDSKAKTVIKRNIFNSTVIEGNHSILLRHFVGFALWSGRFDNSSGNLFPKLIHGRAKIIVCNKFEENIRIR